MENLIDYRDHAHISNSEETTIVRLELEGTIVFREKESVNPLYAEFLRGMLSETNWRGGMFDVLPGNARTTMEGDDIGFFTAAHLLRDTIEVDSSLVRALHTQRWDNP
jgi:hypothetical protein